MSGPRSRTPPLQRAAAGIGGVWLDTGGQGRHNAPKFGVSREECGGRMRTDEVIMIGMQRDRQAAPVVANMLEHGVVANATHDTVVRLLPALNVMRAEIDERIEVLEKALEETA